MSSPARRRSVGGGVTGTPTPRRLPVEAEPRSPARSLARAPAPSPAQSPFPVCSPSATGAKPVFHLVFSTKWTWEGEIGGDLPEEAQDAMRRANAIRPLCCELTGAYFRDVLAKEAKEHGYEVVRWPINSQKKWLALGEAASDGRMKPGVAAVLLHSWHGDYDKECVPAWDFYPVLEAIKAKQVLLYPSASLDQLHSEKKYTSRLMPPTIFVHLRRAANGTGVWELNPAAKKEVGAGVMAASITEIATATSPNRRRSASQTPRKTKAKDDSENEVSSGVDVLKAVAQAVKMLSVKAKERDLPLEDVMVKQGLSWGGEAVARVAPQDVPTYVEKKVLPKLRAEVDTITLLFQAKVELVSELRWMVLDGVLRGRGWKTLKQAPRGRLSVTAGYRNEKESRKSLSKAGLAADDESRRDMEESMRPKVEQVVAEAVADAGGIVPHYLRVDLLVDKQGRVWLGERESWGADLVDHGDKLSEGAGPNKVEVAQSMMARASRELARTSSACNVRRISLGSKWGSKASPKRSPADRSLFEAASGASPYPRSPTKLAVKRRSTGSPAPSSPSKRRLSY